MKSALRSAEIIGFFSLPSASLAEHNPAAYNSAMASAPVGAGTCSHCGTGIRHHVVIRDGIGATRFVGTDCAAKVGCDPEQIRERLTDAQREKRDAARAAAADERRKEYEDQVEAERARHALRMESVGDIVEMIRGIGGEFYTSLACQLERGPLSSRQAHYVAKATSETGRRNKRNAAAWDDVEFRCMEA